MRGAYRVLETWIYCTNWKWHYVFIAIMICLSVGGGGGGGGGSRIVCPIVAIHDYYYVEMMAGDIAEIPPA